MVLVIFWSSVDLVGVDFGPGLGWKIVLMPLLDLISNCFFPVYKSTLCFGYVSKVPALQPAIFLAGLDGLNGVFWMTFLTGSARGLLFGNGLSIL